MTKIKKRWAAIIVVGTLLLLFFVIAVISAWEDRIEEQFPKWEDANPAARTDVDPNVELQFTGIDFDYPYPNGNIYDVVLIKMTFSFPGGGYTQGRDLYVDYFYEDSWHEIYSSCYGMAVATHRHDGTWGFEVPPGLFARDGKYRMFLVGLGYCDIDIMGIEDVNWEDYISQ